MVKTALACVLSVAVVAPVLASDDSLVRFDGGIGVIPVSSVVVTNGVTTVNRNVVRNINSAGQIWVIESLKADISTDGRIQVRGRGLLLGGGNGIGTNAGASVIASLFCGAAATASEHTTPPADRVALAANGDFRIDDTLNPPPPDECATPVLLIRSSNATTPLGSWFAAGIPKLEHDKN